MWECHLRTCSCLCIAKGQRLDENLLHCCLNDRFGLGAYSSCFEIPGEEPSPTYDSFSFGALDDRLVVGFLGSIVPAT
jgi:hypothetical protein